MLVARAPRLWAQERRSKLTKNTFAKFGSLLVKKSFNIFRNPLNLIDFLFGHVLPHFMCICDKFYVWQIQWILKLCLSNLIVFWLYLILTVARRRILRTNIIHVVIFWFCITTNSALQGSLHRRLGAVYGWALQGRCRRNAFLRRRTDALHVWCWRSRARRWKVHIV